MPEYIRKTITLVRNPNGNYKVDTHTHSQKGSSAKIDTDSFDFNSLEDAVKKTIGYLRDEE